MADELQGLLDRINQEGLEKAEAEKDRIVSAAKDEAKGIVDKAKADAEQLVADAKREAETLQTSGEAGLKQSARDVIISLEQEIRDTLNNVVKTSAGEALTADRLAAIVMELANAYAGAGNADSVEALASEAQLAELQSAFHAKLADRFKGGIEIKPVAGIEAGVKVSFSGDALVHDFTSDAVSEMLCAYVNPRILKIIRETQD
jgi:V/A-type H+-transporting ATPase subunit E